MFILIYLRFLMIVLFFCFLFFYFQSYFGIFSVDSNFLLLIHEILILSSFSVFLLIVLLFFVIEYVFFYWFHYQHCLFSLVFFLYRKMLFFGIPNSSLCLPYFLHDNTTLCDFIGVPSLLFSVFIFIFIFSVNLCQAPLITFFLF